MDTKSTKSGDYSLWADTASGAIRAAFGLVWAIDAFFKWQPAFYQNYLSYITDIASGQPNWLMPWFNMWVKIISVNPNFFSLMTRLIETVIALGLLFGLGRKWIYVLGGVFALVIWAVPEGFGGPYTPGATDLGGGLIYVFVFIALIVMDYALGRSPYSVDFYLERRFPKWAKLVEWAPADVLAKEPRYLPWRIQTPIIIGIVILMAIVLAILASELNANAALPPSTFIGLRNLAMWMGVG